MSRVRSPRIATATIRSRGWVWLMGCALGAALALGPACGQAPKPEELNELDRIWADPNTQKVRTIPGAQRYFEQAYDLRLKARQAYEEGDVELAREYAIWSKLKYRTAEALAEQHEAKARVEAANARVREINPTLQARNQARNELTQAVKTLEMQVRVAEKRKADEEARLAALRSGNASGNGGAVDDAALRQQLNTKLQLTQTQRQAAEQFRASEFAPAPFNQADNLYKSVQAGMSGDIDTSMLQSLDQAIALFKRAQTQAKPRFEDWKIKQQPEVRNATLLQQARKNFGADYAAGEPNGARIILTSLFDAGESNFALGTDAMLKALLALAKEYDEYELLIEGFTSKKGNATENLAVSQNRAFAVRDYLQGKGIDKSRLTTRGQGEDRIRYPSDASKNDRVEVVFRRK